MLLTWSSKAWADYLHWQREDPAVLAKVNALIKEAQRTPFTGLGKPEPLSGDLAGWWSRRITAEHRLVYRVVGKPPVQALEIAACRGHYG